MNLKLFPQAIILVSVPVIFQLIFVITLARLLTQAEADTARETRTREVIASTDHLTRLFQQFGFTVYGYYSNKDSALPKQLQADRQAMYDEIDHLRPLVAGRVEEKQTLDQVVKEVDKISDFGDRVVKGIGEGVDYADLKNALEARMVIMSGSNNFLRLLRQLVQLERESTKQVKDEGPATRKLIWNCLILGVALNILLAFFLARLFYKGTSSRLNHLVDNTKRLSSGAPLKFALSGNDEIAELDGVFHDMAIKLAEASRKERAVIDNALDAIFALDTRLSFMSANPAAKQVFGLQPQKLIGKKLATMVAKDDWIAVQTALEKCRDEEAAVTFDCRVVRPNESYCSVQWSVYWSDSDRCFFCVVHDITERKRIEIMKQDFVSMISHDLRTPLMSVQADIELLSAESSPPPKTAKRLDSAARNIRYVITLINSLLDLERMATDKLEVHLALVRLQDVFDKTLDAVLPLAQKKQIMLQAPPTTAIISADEARLAQVLINLISNALKFSEKNTSIKLQARELVDEIEIRVIDQGRGIPKDKLDSIFGRFEQVEESDATVRGGAGLGLAICKKIIEEHHGQIGVESKEGTGSEFWIRSPL